MLASLFALVGFFTVLSWIFAILFPRTVLRIRLAIFAASMARMLQAHASRLQQQPGDKPRS